MKAGDSSRDTPLSLITQNEIDIKLYGHDDSTANIPGRPPESNPEKLSPKVAGFYAATRSHNAPLIGSSIAPPRTRAESSQSFPQPASQPRPPSRQEATVDPLPRGARLDANHPKSGVLIPCNFTNAFSAWWC